MADLLTPDPHRLVAIDRPELPPTMPGVIQSSGYSAALSPDQQTISDVVAQVYRGTSVVRHSPLPPQASAAVGAAANSAAKTIVEENTTGNTTTYVPGTNVTFTQQSQNVFAINAASSSSTANVIPIKRWALVQAIAGTALASGNGEQIILDNVSIGNSNGTQAAGGPTSTFGPYTQAQAGTGAGGGFQYYAGTAGFWSSRNPYLLVRAGFNSAADHGALSSFIWLCMSDQTSGTTMRTATPAGANQFGFLFNSAASSNWIISVGVAGAYTSQTTSVAADAASHQFEAACGASSVTFAIDGVTVGTIGAVPTMNTALRTLMSVSDNTTSTLNFNLERWYAQCDF